MISLRLLVVPMSFQTAAAFLAPVRPVLITPAVPPSSAARATALSMAVVSYDELLSRVEHYAVAVPKPMGVIFGENPSPYLGLVLDDVAEGLNGGRAGLRVGDQLLAVNEQVVVGKDFDSVMESLQDGPSTLSLVMYRGPVEELFAVLDNQMSEGETLYDEGDEDELNSQPVVMDENYETPLVVEVKAEEPLDYAKGFRKLGGMIMDTLTSAPEEGASDSSPPPKKNTGFFGIGGETVQLDGEDATGTGRRD